MPDKRNNSHKYVAFFDLDHTIFNVNSGRILIEHAHKQRLIHTKQIILAYVFSMLFRTGLIGAEFIMKKLTVWLKGINEKKFADFAGEIFERYLKENIRPGAKQEIEYHRNNHARTVILSAAVHYVCSPVKELLNIDDMLCSKMEVADGIFTGRSNGKYCYGEEKLNKVIRYCRNNHFRLEEAYYYADAYSDLNVLQSVGHPVCVTPDSRLQDAAVNNNWTILYW